MIAYLTASLFSAIFGALFSLIILDAGWVMAAVGYLTGGWIGFAATLLSVMRNDDGAAPPRIRLAPDIS